MTLLEYFRERASQAMTQQSPQENAGQYECRVDDFIDRMSRLQVLDWTGDYLEGEK
jgi:hypothetical protein